MSTKVDILLLNVHSEPIATLVFAVVVLCWFVFGGIYLFRKKHPNQPVRKRGRASLIGILLQVTSYFIVWMWWRERPLFSPNMPFGKPIEIIVALATVAIAVGSVGMVMAAISTLGKQWSNVARVVEGHKLITAGPYRLVRHPIYTGMLGLLLATGLAVSNPIALLLAAVLFSIGMAIRIRAEEKLLREEFGPEWEAYAGKVPAVIPGLY